MFGKRYPNCVKKKTKSEEVEFQEKLDLKKADMGDVVKDFYKSDAPQFKGRSKEKRREMAIAAKLTAERGKLPEEVVTEVSKKTLGNYVKKASTDLATRSIKHGMTGGTETGGDPDSSENVEKINKRHSGIMKAVDKLKKEGFSNWRETLDEKCWKGYEKKGMKTMFGKRYPNCVKKEETEVVNEVSKKTLGNYIKKASTDLATRSIKHGMTGGTEKGGDPDSPKNVEKINKRHSGIMKATDKLTEDDMKGMSVKSGHKRPTKSGAGMTKKGVEAYRRRNPGSKLKTAVTTPPSKLNAGSKAANRRKSYCARSAGQMKKFPKAAKDPNSRLRQARRRWNC